MGHWFGAHALSLVTFAPPIFLILRRRWLDTSKFSRQRLLEWLGLLGAVALATLITFGQSKVPLVIVPLVPMVAAIPVGTAGGGCLAVDPDLRRNGRDHGGLWADRAVAGGHGHQIAGAANLFRLRRADSPARGGRT
jgi:4-amino-4-deoxy-L-arabinose transferase-like glycosyltransferase